MFTVTKEWIHAHATGKGGWTRRQLALLGTTWPPPAGWMNRLEGLVILDHTRALFEHYGALGATKTSRADHVKEELREAIRDLRLVRGADGSSDDLLLDAAVARLEGLL